MLRYGTGFGAGGHDLENTKFPSILSSQGDQPNSLKTMGSNFKTPEIGNVAVMAARVIQSSVKRFGFGHWGTLIDGLNAWREIQAT